LPDRRSVDHLTIEELERLLITKRRELRRDRLRRLSEMADPPMTCPYPTRKPDTTAETKPERQNDAQGEGLAGFSQ